MALANSRAQLASRRTAVKAHASAVKKPRSAIADAKRVLAAAIVAGSALASQVTPARAEDAVDAATSTAIEAVKATGAAAKTAIDFLGVGVKAVQQGYEAAAPVIKQGVDVVAPVVSSAVKVTADTAVPAIKAATPVVTNTVTSALKATGLDVEAAANTTGSVAKTAASSALPALTGAAAWLASKDPVTLGEYGLGAAALYFLAPALLGGLAGGLRGFAGELTATQALDAINNDSTAILIDVRTSAEKERGGLPDVAGNARDRSIEVEFAVTEDRRLRGQLRDPSAIEAQITALQIASLKRIGKGSRIVLLDKNGGQAKAVAKELSRRGFGKVFVVGGGFEGRGGWVQSKLLVKPAAGSFTSSSPLQNIARTISTRTVSSGGRKQLPAPSK